MGIVREMPGALKPATLNWLASQVRVRFLSFPPLRSSILVLGLDFFWHPVHSAFCTVHPLLPSRFRLACGRLPSYASGYLDEVPAVEGCNSEAI
jgi:hypothetical protein